MQKKEYWKPVLTNLVFDCFKLKNSELDSILLKGTTVLFIYTYIIKTFHESFLHKYKLKDSVFIF